MENDQEMHLEDLVDKLKAEHNISDEQAATVRTNYDWLVEKGPDFDLDLEGDQLILPLHSGGVLGLISFTDPDFQQEVRVLQRHS